VKVSTGAGLKLVDYFTPHNTVSESSADLDLGLLAARFSCRTPKTRGASRSTSPSAPVKTPSFTLRTATTWASSTQTRTRSIRKFQPARRAGLFHARVLQWHGYFGAVGDALKAFRSPTRNLHFPPATQTTHNFLSGNDAKRLRKRHNNGIVWAIENSGAILFAYDATDLTKELYDSDQAANGRDHSAAMENSSPR